MVDIFIVATTGIIDKLLTSPLLLEEAGNGSSEVRAYAVVAPQDDTGRIPYILLQYDGGGEENVTPKDSFDLNIRVSAIAYDLFQAGKLASEIREVLHEQTLNLPAPWSDWATCKYQNPYTDAFSIQGTQYYMVGATYRVRGTK